MDDGIQVVMQQVIISSNSFSYFFVPAPNMVALQPSWQEIALDQTSARFGCVLNCLTLRL